MSPEQILAAQRGDVIALGTLLDELMPWVGRLCGSIALDAGPDAAQETMIQVMRDLAALREPAALGGWVRRIALRESIRHAERARREPILDANDPQSAAHSGAGPAREARTTPLDPMLARDVQWVLAQLPTDQRTVLVLRDLDGLSEAETAEQLDVAVGTVKSRLSRAREAFRQRWTE